MRREAQPGDGGVYAKGNILWLWYYTAERLPNGKLKRAWVSTELPIGQEKRAEEALEQIRISVLAEVETGVPSGPLTVTRYSDLWLKEIERDGVGSFKDDRTRLRHALPIIGHILLSEVTSRRHIRPLFRELKGKVGKGKDQLSPRTVRHVYSVLHRMFHNAVADGLLPANPCVVKKKDLPKKKDKDPAWRKGAVYTRAEVEQLISDPRIPEERRTLYGLLFIGGKRIGEVSALFWRDYDAQREPLGSLLVSQSYNRKEKELGETKTEQPREVPVHPTLARLLAAWKLGGWERYMGRPPTADDLLFPSGATRRRATVKLSGPDRHLKDNTANANLHQDLKVLGLRARRTHDTRRTMISIGIADGARKDILKWITHGPSGDIMDLYTTLPWETLCAEIGKLRLELKEGRIVELRQVANSSCDSRCDSEMVSTEKPNGYIGLETISTMPRAGLEPARKARREPARAGKSARSLGLVRGEHAHPPPPNPPTVTLSHEAPATYPDSISLALRDMVREWEASHDHEQLRRDLTTLLAAIGGGA